MFENTKCVCVHQTTTINPYQYFSHSVCFSSRALSSILQGYVLVYIEHAVSWRIHLKKGETRSINEPENEKVVRGPKDGFTENLSTNMILIRQRLLNPDLRIEEHTLGTKSRTKVALFFVEHSIKVDVLEEVRRRLQGIDIEAMMDVSYIGEII